MNVNFTPEPGEWVWFWNDNSEKPVADKLRKKHMECENKYELTYEDKLMKYCAEFVNPDEIMKVIISK